MRNWLKKGRPGTEGDGFAAALANLDIPVPFTVEALCETVAEMRGRPIHIHAMDRTGSSDGVPCGAWIALDNSDHIFVESATSPLHRTHIVLHELCHMLLGHSCLPVAEPATTSAETHAPAPPSHHLSVEEWAGFPLNRVVSLLGRTSYAHGDEKAAEGLASLLARRINDAEEAARRPADPLSNHLMNALIE